MPGKRAHSAGPSVPENRQAAGIKDIAKALGVSIGTVDRALHGRAGINPLTRTRVLSMAQTLGYRPNMAARYLKLGRKLRISVHLPREIAVFFDSLRQGILDAASPFESNVEVQFRDRHRLGEGEIEAFQQALDEHADGMILAPGHPSELKSWIRKAARSHIPVVCVATDAPKTERLTSVSTDPYTSGAMVAEIFLCTVRQPGSVLLVTGDLNTFDHAEKLRGFQEFLSMGGHLKLGPVIQAHDDPEEAYRTVSDQLSGGNDICALYVSTANSLPVIRAIEAANHLQNLTIVTTDLFPELAPLIRSGKVLGTVYQRPRTQGRMAFEALYRFLIERKCPPPRLRLLPHIVLRSNLDLILELQRSDWEQPVSWN
ncbi:MAG: substrate-binding domain-containing protein [Bryobacteraceae bacterium]